MIIQLFLILQMFLCSVSLCCARLLALLSELEEHLGISSTAFTMLKLGIQISLAGHLMGCLFYFVSDKSWLHNPEVFVGHGTLDRYVASLYWAFTTMTTGTKLHLKHLKSNVLFAFIYLESHTN